MANENMEIGDIVKKCKILLLDIEGTTTSMRFVKDKLFPYAEENVKQFLDSQWETENVKVAVNALRKLALEDHEQSLEGVVAIPGEDAKKEDQIEGLVSSVKWQMSTDRKVGALKLLQGLIWKQGYDKGEIKGHVYDDVSPALQQWRSVEDQKVYIYSSGCVQAQKLLFGQSEAGDLLPYIDGHFDTAVGAKQDATSYKAIAESIGCKPEEILFLTDILKEAEAAREAGLHAALVSREGNTPLPSEATTRFPLLHSMAQLTVSYKRKTDPQDEQPAKVLKTEADKDVKSNQDVKVTSTEKETMVTERDILEAEKMEIDTSEKKVVVEEKKTEDKKENKLEDKMPEQTKEVETLVEDITESSEATGEKTCDVEPMVEEVEDNSTEETESSKEENSEGVKTTDDAQRPVAGTITEELPATIVTEIEELTDDKQLEEVGDIINDIVPMIEEPMSTEDVDELRNVGEVLEKECDEILSKVQDVTNLSSISSKSTLNPIIEEAMETENTDSNDIVDKILDTELEMQNIQEQTLHSVSESLETVEKTEEKIELANDQGINKESSKEEISAEVDNDSSKEVTGEQKPENATELQNTKNNEDSQHEKTDDSIKPENTVIKTTTNIATEESVVMEEVTNEKCEKNIPINTATEVTQKPVSTEQVTNGQEQTNTNSACTTTKETAQENLKKLSTIEKASSEIDKNEEMGDKKEVDTTSTKEIVSNKTDEESKPSIQTEPVVDNKTQEEKSIVNIIEDSMETNSEDSKVNEQHERQSEDKSCVEKNPSHDKRVEPVEEIQVNGKATTNGDSETVTNGGKEKTNEELSSRLSVANGNDVPNGTNGDAFKAEQGKGDSKTEMEVPDIKVKTVSTDEPHTDPIEQPAQA